MRLKYAATGSCIYDDIDVRLLFFSFYLFIPSLTKFVPGENV